MCLVSISDVISRFGALLWGFTWSDWTHKGKLVFPQVMECLMVAAI